MTLRIIFIFMIYIVLGWIWETSYVSIKEKKFINRGFLKGPYIPIYGFSFITIVLSMEMFNNFNINPILLISIQILYISLISALWEYVTSYLLEVIFHARWWDYSYRKFNIRGRIALDYSVLFGIGGYLLWRFITPIFDNIYIHLPSMALYIIITCFIFILITDTIYTYRDMFKLRNIIMKMELIRDEVSDRFGFSFDYINKALSDGLTSFSAAIGSYKDEISNKFSELKEKGSESVLNKINQFSNLLENSKNVTRFLKKYPKASSKRYKYLIGILRSKNNQDKNQS